MALLIEIKRADGITSRMRLAPGQTRISAQPGEQYRVFDERTGSGATDTTVRQSGKDLIVDTSGHGGQPTRQPSDTPSSVLIEDFYRECSVGNPCSVAVQNGAESAPTIITPGTRSIGALSDGSFVLYDPGSRVATNAGAAAGAEPAASGPAQGFPLKYALYGLGGLALLGAAAAAGGGGGGGDQSDAAPVAPPVGAPGDQSGSAGVNPAAPSPTPTPASGTLQLAYGSTVNSAKPRLVGTADPGSTVTVQYDFDRDGRADVTYSTRTDPQGNWAVDLATVPPSSGALPATGLPASSAMLVSQTTAAGQVSALPVITSQVDTTPPGPVTVQSLGTNGIVGIAQLKSGSFAINGASEPGSTVVVNVGGKTYQAVADPGGQWSVSIPVNSLGASDGTTPVSVHAVDAAGNAGAATQATATLATSPVIAPVGGADHVVTLPELAQGRGLVVQGSTPAGTPAGTIVSVQLDSGQTQNVPTDAAGNWSATFPTPPAAGPVHASATIWGNADGSVHGSAATSDATISTAPPVQNIQVTADNTVNAAEASTGVPLAGVAPAGMTSGTVVIDIDGKPAATGTIGADGNWTAALPAAAIPATDGNHTMTVAASSNGITGAPGNATVFGVDRTPPATTVTLADDAVVSADPAGVDRTVGLTVGGVSEPGARVVVNFNGVDHVATAGAAGVWSVHIAPSQLPPAPATAPVLAPLSVVVTDTHGNSAAMPAQPVTVQPAGSLVVPGVERAQQGTEFPDAPSTASIMHGSALSHAIAPFGNAGHLDGLLAEPYPASTLHDASWVSMPDSVASGSMGALDMGSLLATSSAGGHFSSPDVAVPHANEASQVNGASPLNGALRGHDTSVQTPAWVPTSLTPELLQALPAWQSTSAGLLRDDQSYLTGLHG